MAHRRQKFAGNTLFKFILAVLLHFVAIEMKYRQKIWALEKPGPFTVAEVISPNPPPPHDGCPIHRAENMQKSKTVSKQKQMGHLRAKIFVLVTNTRRFATLWRDCLLWYLQDRKYGETFQMRHRRQENLAGFNHSLRDPKMASDILYVNVYCLLMIFYNTFGVLVTTAGRVLSYGPQLHLQVTL